VWQNFAPFGLSPKIRGSHGSWSNKFLTFPHNLNETFKNACRDDGTAIGTMAHLQGRWHAYRDDGTLQRYRSGAREKNAVIKFWRQKIKNITKDLEVTEKITRWWRFLVLFHWVKIDMTFFRAITFFVTKLLLGAFCSTGGASPQTTMVSTGDWINVWVGTCQNYVKFDYTCTFFGPNTSFGD